MDAVIQTAHNPKRLAFTNGLIWAVINIVIFLATYYFKPDWMGETSYQIIQFLIGLGLAFFFCLNLRKSAGGFWSFKESLSAIFVMFITQALVVYFFTFMFGKVLEPEYLVKMEELRVKTVIEMGKIRDFSQEQINEELERTAGQADLSVRNILLGIAGVIIMYFIGALIFAAILKKEPPVFANTGE